MTRLLVYSVNKLLRDLRKTINRKEFEKRDKIIKYVENLTTKRHGCYQQSRIYCEYLLKK